MRIIACLFTLTIVLAGNAFADIGEISVHASGPNEITIEFDHSGYDTESTNKHNASVVYPYRICWKRAQDKLRQVCNENQVDRRRRDYDVIDGRNTFKLSGFAQGQSYKIELDCYCKKNLGGSVGWKKVGDTTYTHSYTPPPPPPYTAMRELGDVRLHFLATGECLYSEAGTGLTKSWKCWSDPGMAYRLERLDHGNYPPEFALRSVKENKCIAGNIKSGVVNMNVAFGLRCDTTSKDRLAFEIQSIINSNSGNIRKDPVRIYFRKTGSCLRPGNTDGSPAVLVSCPPRAEKTPHGLAFMLDDAALEKGDVRLHNKATGQCIYIGPDNQVQTWNCWNDFGMAFRLHSNGAGAARLESVHFMKCLSVDGDKVTSDACDKAAAFSLAPIAPPSVSHSAKPVRSARPLQRTSLPAPKAQNQEALYYIQSGGNCVSTTADNGGSVSLKPCGPDAAFLLDAAK